MGELMPAIDHAAEARAEVTRNPEVPMFVAWAARRDGYYIGELRVAGRLTWREMLTDRSLWLGPYPACLMTLRDWLKDGWDEDDPGQTRLAASLAEVDSQGVHPEGMDPVYSNRALRIVYGGWVYGIDPVSL